MAAAEFSGARPDELYVVEYGALSDRKYRIYTSEGQALRMFINQQDNSPAMYKYQNPKIIGKGSSSGG
jgi:hypothetical protein